MTINVAIECDTIGEFYAHLTELRRQIKVEAKRLKKSPGDEVECLAFSNLNGNNCYGTHEVSYTVN